MAPMSHPTKSSLNWINPITAATGYADVSRQKSVWKSHTGFDTLSIAYNDSNRLGGDIQVSALFGKSVPLAALWQEHSA